LGSIQTRIIMVFHDRRFQAHREPLPVDHQDARLVQFLQASRMRCVRSSRGTASCASRAAAAGTWTSLVPELAAPPDGLAVDGELIAFGSDGLPSFPRLCDRMLHGRKRIEVMLVIFDLLAVGGRDVTRRPYLETPQTPRRRRLVDHAEPHRRRSVMGEGLRPRPGRRRGEETLGTPPAGPSRLGKDQEPRLPAIPAGARSRSIGIGATSSKPRSVPRPERRA
jgi:hypothetical protein